MGLRDTESCIAWCGRIGLTNRWSLWEWALGLPGNHFLRAGLRWVQEAGFALLCSPIAQSGSVQEEELSPLWLVLVERHPAGAPYLVWGRE